MKLHADHLTAQSIHAHGAGWISVQGQKITHSVVLSSTGDRLAWPCAQWSELTASHFQMLLDLQPEVVVLGTGLRQHFVHPSLYAGLMSRRIGIEIMSTAAACRTYNVLAQENRHVVAALVLEAALSC